MITRRFVLSGLIAAPAVVAAGSLMKVYSLPQRYATVWGVGHDLEVMEHVIWNKEEALQFARGPLYNFREVTEVVYGFDMPPLPSPIQSHWTDRPQFKTPAHILDNSPVVKENGFTKIMTFSHMSEWQESLRPDLNGKLSVEWTQEQIQKEKELGLTQLNM